MFNSREYEWSDITIMLGGKVITAARSIKYNIKQEKEPVYGKGNEPIAIQKGNISYGGEIAMLQSELETIRANANGSVLKLQLDAVVAYGNPANGDVMITYVIQGMQFTEEPHEMKQGDKMMEVTLPFIALRIKKVI